MNLRESKSVLGLGHHPTRRLLGEAGLIRAGGTRRAYPTVARKDVEAIRNTLERLIDRKTAAKRAGITLKAFTRLVTTGTFQPDGAGKVAYGPALRMDPVALDEALDRLKCKAPALAELPPGTATLVSASRSAGKGGLAKACRLIDAGRIMPVGVLSGAVGLSSIVVDRTAMGKVMHDFDADDCSVAEAAAALSLRAETIAALIASGHIEAHGAGPRTKIVRRSEVERFSSRFVTTSTVARRWRTNTRSAVAILRGSGLRPAIVVTKCGRRQVGIFDRRAVDAAQVPARLANGRRIGG